jgi:putative ABC transport system substrate-binding protein
LGWTDGRNVRMDVRWSGGDYRLRAFAQGLVGLQPDIILTNGTAATVEIQRETQTIPIVFANVTDPVASGLVTRRDRPSGNNLRNIRQSRTRHDIFSSKAYDFA